VDGSTPNVEEEIVGCPIESAVDPGYVSSSE
jgi:hypothetical protein